MSNFQYRSLIDLSHCLSPNNPVFNPSIAQIRDTKYYIVCYRSYLRNDKFVKFNTKTIEQNHPWLKEDIWAYTKFLVVDKTKLEFDNSLKEPENWNFIFLNAKDNKKIHIC